MVWSVGRTTVGGTVGRSRRGDKLQVFAGIPGWNSGDSLFSSYSARAGGSSPIAASPERGGPPRGRDRVPISEARLWNPPPR